MIGGMDELRMKTGEFYAAIDSRDWDAVGRLVAPGFTVSVSDSAPMGLAEWRRQLEAFHEGFRASRRTHEAVFDRRESRPAAF